MTTNFFRLFMQVSELPNAWYLRDVLDQQGEELTGAEFTTGKEYSLLTGNPLTVTWDGRGDPVDYRLTTRAVPIMSTELGDVIAKLAPQAVQRIPILIIPSHTGYEILNVITKVNCLDTVQSHITRYEHDFYPPEKKGKVSGVGNLKIISEQAEGHHIFRLGEFSVVIIVSETLKSALDQRGFSGLEFTPV